MPDQQPNLFFASVQYLTGPEEMPMSRSELSSFVGEHEVEVAQLMRSRRTQTNEVGRCAVLLPAMPAGPLALVEVGASAGLCLMPDKYRYDYGSLQIGDIESPVRLRCHLRGNVRPRIRVPQIVWRCGLDRAPVDLDDPSDVRWLLACIWPDHSARRERMEAAIEVGRRHSLSVRHGDLVDDLPQVLEEAPTGATLVVFHSAVFPYVSPERRQAFARLLTEFSRRRDVVWISNEGPRGLLTSRPACRRRDPFSSCWGGPSSARGSRTRSSSQSRTLTARILSGCRIEQDGLAVRHLPDASEYWRCSICRKHVDQ